MLNLIRIISNFLISQWIWSVTWGLNHSLYSGILLLIFLKFFEHVRLVRAIILSFLLQIIAFAVYFLFVGGILVGIFKIPYVPMQTPDPYTLGAFGALIAQGIIYACIQIMLMLLINRRAKLIYTHMVIYIILSHIFACVMSYKLLPTYA